MGLRADLDFLETRYNPDAYVKQNLKGFGMAEVQMNTLSASSCNGFKRFGV